MGSPSSSCSYTSTANSSGFQLEDDRQRAPQSPYCVRTATLVEPRVTPLASLNRTNTRFAAGSNGTVPSPATNRPKVGVAPALIVTVTVGLGSARHAPVPGSVSQIVRAIGSAVTPVSAAAVMIPLAPTFTVATAKTPVPLVPAIFTMPSLFGVAASATMSGTGVEDAERITVSRPGKTGAGGEFAQVKLNC